MTTETNRKTPAGAVMQHTDDHIEKAPMHPDDFEAHLAWITAKRFHELVLKETFAEKPVFYRVIG